MGVSWVLFEIDQTEYVLSDVFKLGIWRISISKVIPTPVVEFLGRKLML